MFWQDVGVASLVNADGAENQPQYELVSSLEHHLPLLADRYFGRGTKGLLVDLAENLLSESTINTRVAHLFNSGIVSQDDTILLNILDNLSEPEWHAFALILRDAEMIPGVPLHLVMDLPMTLKQGQCNFSDAQRTIPASKDKSELRYNQIFEQQPLKPKVLFERYTHMNGEMVRNLPLMPCDSGSRSVLAMAYAFKPESDSREGVIIKIARTDNPEYKAAVLHEFNVLKMLAMRPGITKLYVPGILNIGGSANLVLYLEANDSYALETLDVDGILRVMNAVLTIVQDVHGHGLIHGNLLPSNFLYDSIHETLTLSSFQYACIDPEASIESQERCIGLGIPSQSPLPWRKSNLLALDTAPKNKKHDIIHIGVLLLCLLHRDLKLFSKRRELDLSSLNNLDTDALNSILHRGCEVFNSYFSSKSGQNLPLIAVQELGQALLNPAGLPSCNDARAIIQRFSGSPGRPMSSEIVVPAKYVVPLRELQRCTELFKRLDCVDQNGEIVPGWGVRSRGGARRGDLLCPYFGQVLTKSAADRLNAQGQGTNLKSIIIGGQQMVLDGRTLKNGFCDIFHVAEHGHASKINCNANVRVKRDGKGGKVVTLTRFPANAHFEEAKLSQPYKLAVPGCYMATHMIIVRAARDLEDGEEVFLDYGPGTTMKMFGCCSGDVLISKSLANNSKDSGRKRQCVAKK